MLHSIFLLLFQDFWGGGGLKLGVGNPRAHHPLYETLVGKRAFIFLYLVFLRMLGSGPGAIVNVDIPLWMGHLEAIRNKVDFSLSRGSGFTLRGCS